MNWIAKVCTQNLPTHSSHGVTVRVVSTNLVRLSSPVTANPRKKLKLIKLKTNHCRINGMKNCYWKSFALNSYTMCGLCIRRIAYVTLADCCRAHAYVPNKQRQKKKNPKPNSPQMKSRRSLADLAYIYSFNIFRCRCCGWVLFINSQCFVRWLTIAQRTHTVAALKTNDRSKSIRSRLRTNEQSSSNNRNGMIFTYISHSHMKPWTWASIRSFAFS